MNKNVFEYLAALAKLVPGSKLILLSHPKQVRVVRHVFSEKKGEIQELRIQLEPAMFFKEAVLCMGGSIAALSDGYRVLDDVEEIETLERDNPYHLLPRGPNFLVFREQRP